MGMIYPEGVPELWYYKVAKVKEIPESERVNYPKEDGNGYYETFLDVDVQNLLKNMIFLMLVKLWV